MKIVAGHRIPDHVPAALVYDFDYFADSAKSGDVQAAHAALHDTAPDIFYTPRNGGHWMAIRFADVKAIMTTPEIFSSVKAVAMPSWLRISLPPQDMDAPEHLRYRLLLLQFLAPKEIRKLEGQIRQLMTELIDRVVDRGHCEFMAEVAVPLPVQTFMGLMHMDLARYSEFVRWANGILGSESPWKRLPHFLRMTRYLKSLIRDRKRNPKDDPVSMLLAAEVHGQKLSDKRVLEVCNLLFLAGLDTVTNAMVFMTRHLASHPQQQQQLRDHPEKIPAAIEEMMRRYSFPNIPRRVVRETKFGQATFLPGDIVISSLAASGTDPRNVDHPLQVDFDRPRSPHFGFNTGPHTCAGSHLARLELRVFLEEWLRRVPPFQIASDWHPHARGGPVMALESLSLTWEAVKQGPVA